MFFLKDEANFKKWKKKNIVGEDTADRPKEFPCWVETQVQSWNYQEKYAWYLYREDIEKMLKKMTPNAPVRRPPDNELKRSDEL